jgi:hypothetical protein
MTVSGISCPDSSSRMHNIRSMDLQQCIEFKRDVHALPLRRPILPPFATIQEGMCSEAQVCTHNPQNQARAMTIDDGQKVWLVTGQFFLLSADVGLCAQATVGASSGLGYGLVRRALARGDRVIATARSVHKLEAALAYVPDDERVRLRILRLNVLAGFEELRRVATTAIAFWGRVDVLVNNAGIIGHLGASEEIG